MGERARMVQNPMLLEAYKRVVGNKGCAGVDGMTVDDLRAYLNDGHWERTSDQSFACSFLQIPPHDEHPCCSTKGSGYYGP